MPIINTFETDKFHAITTKLYSKQKFDKQTSNYALARITEKPTSTIITSPALNPETSRQKLREGSSIANSTIRRGSVLTLDNHMQTISGNHIYLSASIRPQLDYQDIPSSNKTSKSTSSSIALQTSSGSRLQELKALHQQLVNMSETLPNKPVYEPRRPTMESIKEAIEKARKEEIERNKSTSTVEPVLSTLASVSHQPFRIPGGSEFKQDAVVEAVDKKVKKPKSRHQTAHKKTKRKQKIKVDSKIKTSSSK